MAKKNKSKSKKRKSGKRKGKRSYRRGGRGGRRFIQKPTKRTLYVAAAVLGTEVLAESVIPDTLPDFVNEDAVGVWLAGYWLKSGDMQEVAYALEAVHVARDNGLVDTFKEKIGDLTGGMIGGARGGAGAQADYSALVDSLMPSSSEGSGSDDSNVLQPGSIFG